MPSPTLEILDYTSKIAVTCISTLLIACNPLLLGGITGGLDGSSSVGVTQCENGSQADLSGVCRNNTPSMGALEAFDSQAISAAAVNTLPATQEVTGKSVLNVNWSPYQGTASGYFVYYGTTSETATTLASDLPVDTINFTASAPSVSYQPTLDLGLSAGDNVCFLILAYDTARVPFTWSQILCTVV